MSSYSRARVPGASYFFTVNLRDRRSDLLVREIVLLRATVRATRTRHLIVPTLPRGNAALDAPRPPRSPAHNRSPVATRSVTG